MKHFKIFLKLIWKDVGMSPLQIIAATVAGIVISGIIMIPIISLAYFLSWITKTPVKDGVLSASIGLWVIFLGIVLLAGYIKKKWHESA